MLAENILNIIKNGKKNTVEFKLCSNECPKSIYETVCSFLNTKGGIIILGVNDNKEIIGVNKDNVFKIQKDFSSAINNSELITPISFLSMEEIEIDNKTILYIQVPESSEVHRYKNKIYLRNHEGDYNITNNRIETTNLYLRKQSNYTENTVYPYINIEEDLRIDLLKRVNDVDRYDDRVIVETNLIEAYNKCMDFVEEHLPSPFYLEGTTRIDIKNIIFREIIANMLIHAEYSKNQATRFTIYKDKIVVENGNKPYLNGIINFDNCEPYQKNPNIAKMFRMIGKAEQIGSGTLKLYKYCKAYGGSEPTMTDENTFVLTLPINVFENQNTATKQDIIKNDQDTDQDIAKSDKDKLNTPQDTPQDKAGIINGKMNYDKDTIQDSDKDNDQDSDKDIVKSDKDNKLIIMNKILTYCENEMPIQSIMKEFNFKHETYFKKQYLTPLIQQGKLSMTIPDKPTSRYQKYITIKK